MNPTEAPLPPCPCCNSNARVVPSPRPDLGQFFCQCNEPGRQYFNLPPDARKARAIADGWTFVVSHDNPLTNSAVPDCWIHDDHETCFDDYPPILNRRPAAPSAARDEAGESDGKSLYLQWCGGSYEWEALTDVEKRRWNRLHETVEKAVTEAAGTQALLELKGRDKFLANLRRDEFEPLKAENAKLRAEAAASAQRCGELEARLESAMAQLEEFSESLESERDQHGKVVAELTKAITERDHLLSQLKYIAGNDENQLGLLLSEITEERQSEKRDLAAQREACEGLSKELQNIATANYRGWDEPFNTAEDFVKWAQSRARAALTQGK